MPRKNLTVAFVESAKGADGARTEFYDTGRGSVRGLVLRVNGRSKIWRVATRVDGRWTRFNIGAYPDARGKLPALDLAQARTLARVKLGDVAKGEDPAATKRADKEAGSFGQLGASYLALHARPNKRSADEDERILNAYLLPKWKHRKAKDISSEDVQALIDEIAARPAPIMANRVRALASKIFKWGKNRGYQLTGNPVTDTAKPGVERAVDRVLTPEQIRIVWNALDAETLPIRALFRLRLITGQRGGEVLRMRWQDLDLEGNWWTIPKEHAKNKREHRVPLTASALLLVRQLKSHGDTIEKQRGARSQWLFPSPSWGKKTADRTRDVPIRNVMKALGRIRESCGVEFRGHDLRHTAATLMAEAGVPESYIPKVLNHVEPNITRQVYNRYSYDREKRQALDAWDRKLVAILKNEKGASNLLTFVARGA